MDTSSENESAGLSLSLISTTPKKPKSPIASSELDNLVLPRLSLAAPISLNKDEKSSREKRKMAFDSSPRKKLRLTKQQSYVLEQSFKDHPTLNLNQKQELAEELKLKPRQVEVWFQNRRARTKLKKTEMEYEELKRQCEKLTEDNNRMKKELLELKNIQLIRLFMD